ncbi:MAG TPA: prolyl oligopeptidase family serine peptidase [Candidatus Dormibacteraeota bacterium]|nr:prolyl oligopeptidase family serine peptidase [Candidatus Dormibacteraeota bacterium]
MFAGPIAAGAGGGVSTLTGTLADGATYEIQVPASWNGTLVLYSHGYVNPGSANPAQDVGDLLTGGWLLGNGYALAGSSYATTGWAIQQAIPDQIATLDRFDASFGTPRRTIAWGHSLGGIITAGLLQTHPDRFTAALPMCGVVAGGVGTWNQALDSEFAIQQLIGPGSGLQVVHITNPGANLGLSEQLLFGAQATPQGRARIALASALGDLPGWFDPASSEPAATDFVAQEANQFSWLTQVDGPFVFALRAELEARAGGNPSWNTGVNYAKQLVMSSDFSEVRGLYAAAGLSLRADLATLDAAPRISADPGAVAYLTQNVIFNGNLSGKPVLTLHTTGDGLVVVTDEQAYRSVIQDAKDSQLLRQAFVHRAGHCTFTPAETIAAFKALIKRIDTGKWTGSTNPGTLNTSAAALGPTFNVASPAFLDFAPRPFLRPYDLGSH